MTHSRIAQLASAHTTTHARNRISARGLISGAAYLLDIFATRARPRKRRAPADDARNLHRDLEKIGQDFSRVLSGIGTASNK